MPNTDSFTQNILGVGSLIGDDTNKTKVSDGVGEEGIASSYEDVLDLPMSDEELLDLKRDWESKYNTYGPKIKARQERNKAFIRGIQKANQAQSDVVVPTNILFEATATFVPEALAENPEPVVYSDDTPEGKQASNDLKTMLQFHAEIFALRKKLGVMVWHWSAYLTAILKYGWDEKTGEITMNVRKPQNFIFDPDGYVDEFGDFKGEFIGERIEKTAKELIELFPSSKGYITLKANGKLGTKVKYTEWWNDDYCFSTFEDVVLDKHKNEFFNYGDGIKTDENGNFLPTMNHFALPKMPYTLLSVFSWQERPHDFTNLVEQNIANQERINDRDGQIDKNLASGNNAVALSGLSFTTETAGQAVESFYQEGFLLVPDGNMEAVKRIPASLLPNGIIETQEIMKNDLRSIYGTLGSTPTASTKDETARGMILNQQHDTSRTGGGVGDSLETVAKAAFNWLAQLYCVFYDTEHYGTVLGNAKGVEYTSLTQQNMERKYVISVSPNSMKPKDEVSQMNLAMERWAAKAIDPINLMKELQSPDPMNDAKQLVMWLTNPQQYAMTFFGGEVQPSAPPQTAGNENPNLTGTPAPELAGPGGNANLSNVPIKSPIQQPNL